MLWFSAWSLALKFLLNFFRPSSEGNHLENVESNLLTLISCYQVRLEQFSIHLEELQKEIFIEGKGDLAMADLVDHHERYKIFLFICAMVYHVHVDDVILRDDVSPIWVILNFLIFFTSPYFSFMTALSTVFFILETQLENYIKDACAYIKMAEIANKLLELGFFTHF